MKLIAHRGASGDFPENTPAAFRGALAQGAREIEIDVRQDAAGELVVLHDATLKRVAGDPRRVAEVSPAELARLDVGSWFDPRFSGERVPRVEQILALLAEGCEIHFDVKDDAPRYPDHAAKVLAAARGVEEWARRCTFSSEHVDILRAIRAAAPEARLGYQPRETPLRPALAAARDLRAESLRLRADRVTPAWLAAARAAELEVYVYTVNDEAAARALAAAGVRRIFTNYPAMRPALEAA